MIRASVSLVAAILSALASVTVNAQDDTVVRVDYVAVLVQADGTESPHAEGVHYIASDGRYRHDQTPAGREYRCSRFAPLDISMCFTPPSPEQPVQPIGAQRARPVDFASPRPRSPPAALGIERDGCDPGPRSRLPAEAADHAAAWRARRWRAVRLGSCGCRWADTSPCGCKSTPPCEVL